MYGNYNYKLLIQEVTLLVLVFIVKNFVIWIVIWEIFTFLSYRTLNRKKRNKGRIEFLKISMVKVSYDIDMKSEENSKRSETFKQKRGKLFS